MSADRKGGPGTGSLWEWDALHERNHAVAPPNAEGVCGALLGDDLAWSRYLPWAWRASVSPDLAGPPQALTKLQRQEEPYSLWASIAYWTPLLHILLYGLGWSRVDLGLERWLRAGRLTDDPILDFVNDWFPADEIEGLLAFAASGALFRERVPALWASCLNIDNGNLNTTVELSGTYRDRIARPDWQQVWGGGTDPMHLSGHCIAPAEPPSSPVFISPVSTDPDGLPRATAVADSYQGWYHALMASALPARVDGRDVRVDVVCRPLGWLGQYRRSTETGLWFRGRHAIHVMGN